MANTNQRPHVRWYRAASRLLAGFGLAVALSGCRSDQVASQRVVRYEPAITAAERTPWVFREAKPSERVDKEVAVSSRKPAPESGIGSAGGQDRRRLERGSAVGIALRGIPQAQDVQEVIDDQGNITLPLVGTIQIEGMTSSEAENKIKRAYVESGFYRKIDVILVAQEAVYFVRGEVQRPGQYVLNGDVTLLMALSIAGGYTDYANRRKIRIIRGEELLRYNADRIEKRDAEDPVLQSDDIIVVERKIFL